MLIWSWLLLAAAPERPALPVLPSLPPVATCDDPAARRAFLDTTPNNTGAVYTSAWTAYLDARMAAIGLTKKERAELSLRVLNDPEFDAAMAAGFDAARGMLSGVEAMLTTNEAEQCRLVIKMIAAIPPTLAAAERQWSMLEKALDAEEARRRPITR